MFDKNRFKEVFRRYVDAHPGASDDDALEFCRQNLPAQVLSSHYWLIDQSLQWFRWVRTQRAVLADHELNRPESGDEDFCH
jgi:hypothetical protein